MIVGIAKLTQPDLRQIAKTTNTPQFLTLEISHYVEFARWSLQLGHIPFVEHGYAAVQHVLPAVATRLGKTKDENVFHDSTIVEPVKSSLPSQTDSQLENPIESTKSKSKGKASNLPLLVLPDGRIMKDSWEIATYAGMYNLCHYRVVVVVVVVIVIILVVLVVVIIVVCIVEFLLTYL